MVTFTNPDRDVDDGWLNFQSAPRNSTLFKAVLGSFRDLFPGHAVKEDVKQIPESEAQMAGETTMHDGMACLASHRECR